MQVRKHTRWTVLLLLIALTMIMTACGEKNRALGGQPSSEEPGVQTETPAVTETPTAEPTSTPVPEQTKEVNLYYADLDLNKLLERTTTVTYVEDQEVYAATLNALKSSDDPEFVSLFSNVSFNSVILDGDALRVDLSFIGGSQLGSGGESFFVEALKKAVFQFPEVNKLYITLDGNEVESLMGHVDLEHPFKK